MEEAVVKSGKRALIVVDMQNDFLDGGALGIKRSMGIIPEVLRYMDGDYDLIVTTQDWHPSNHGSFSIWPVHCVENTKGAELHSSILEKFNSISKDKISIKKGVIVNEAGYSAFESTTLKEDLKSRDITEVTVVGLALDHCVRATALDSVKSGFKTFIGLDGTARVAKVMAFEEMKAMEMAGISFHYLSRE